MTNTSVQNCIFVCLLISLQMCSNFEYNIDEYDNFDDEVLTLEDIDYTNEYDSANSETNEKLINRLDSYNQVENSKDNANSSADSEEIATEGSADERDSYNKNNKKNKSDILTDYPSDTNITDIWDDNDNETRDENSYMIGFPYEKSRVDCDNCFPGLLKGDLFTISKAIDKVHDKNNRIQYDFGIKTEFKRENKKEELGSIYSNPHTVPIITSKASDEEVDVEEENVESEKPTIRVVNGWPAKLGDVPYQVAFKQLTSRARQEYITFCGGTIIGPTKLISAAHCFEGRKKSFCQLSGSRLATKKQLRQTQVVAGNLRNLAKYNDGGQWRKLKSMVYPFKYKFPSQDISVGFVTKRFDFNDYVNQIPFATEHTEYEKTICLVSGYGRINEYERSDKLLLANLVLRSTTYCTKIHRTNMKKFICTDSVPSDIERGDSGGPLVCSGVLVGVVSGHRYNSGSFFTRVSSFSDYIKRGKATMLSCNTFYVYSVHVLIIVFKQYSQIF